MIFLQPQIIEVRTSLAKCPYYAAKMGSQSKEVYLEERGGETREAIAKRVCGGLQICKEGLRDPCSIIYISYAEVTCPNAAWCKTKLAICHGILQQYYLT